MRCNEWINACNAKTKWCILCKNKLMRVMQLWFLGYMDWSFKSFSLIKLWVQNWVSTMIVLIRGLSRLTWTQNASKTALRLRGGVGVYPKHRANGLANFLEAYMLIIFNWQFWKSHPYYNRQALGNRWFKVWFPSSNRQELVPNKPRSLP